MPSGLLRVFVLTGIDQVIPNFPSLEQALAHLPANGSDGRLRPR